MSFRFHLIWVESQGKFTAEKVFRTLLRTNGGYFLQYMLRFHSRTIFSVHDRKILHHFVRICRIFVSQVLEIDAVRESQWRLTELIKLIEQHYGRDKITPNLHLSLHLTKYTRDYGPLYAFWCFSFERMNGVLDKL